MIPVGGHFIAKQHAFLSVQALLHVCVCGGETLPAAPDNLLLSHCVIFHSFKVACVSAHMCVFACGCVHIRFFLSRVMSVSRLRFVYLFVVRGPDSLWQLRSATKCPAILLSLPDDFANGSDCLRQSFPRQASSSSASSSNHHSNAFLPLMTHWAWLHNSHRRIASTWMRVCLWCSQAIKSNIDFSIIFFLLI